MNQSASPEQIRGLVRDFMLCLSYLYTELVIEAGPFGPGLRGIVAATARDFARIEQGFAALRAGLPPAPELTDLSRFLFRFNNDIAGRLNGIQYLTERQELVDVGSHLQVRCLALIGDLSNRFDEQPLPIHLRTEPYTGRQAIVVSDLVAYTPRALAMIPAGNQLGDDGVVNFVEQLDETIRQQLIAAFSSVTTDRWEDHLIASTGDGAIVRFDRATDALAYARDSRPHASVQRHVGHPDTVSASRRDRVRADPTEGRCP